MSQVTLLEDRAYVVRQGTVELPVGPGQLRLEVSSTLADKTATARVLPTAGRCE